MKTFIIHLQIIFGISSIFASGIVEYNGQNYFAGMGTSFWAITYALNSTSE